MHVSLWGLSIPMCVPFRVPMCLRCALEFDIFSSFVVYRCGAAGQHHQGVLCGFDEVLFVAFRTQGIYHTHTFTHA